MLGRVMKWFINFVIRCLLLGVSSAADFAPPAVGSDSWAGQIRVVPASDPLLTKAAGGGDAVGRLLKAAKPTIGVRYKWGGTRMDEGIDCSNYTGLLYRSGGMGFRRLFRIGVFVRARWSQWLWQDCLRGRTGWGSAGLWVSRRGREMERPCRSEERRVGKECRSRWSPY